MPNQIVHKILVSALLFTTFNDFIQGSVTDILAPILNAIIPGDIRKPTKFLGINFYFTRFVIRLINVYIALIIVFKLKSGTFSFIPFKRNANIL
jgi:hypothetical protein